MANKLFCLRCNHDADYHGTDEGETGCGKIGCRCVGMVTQDTQHVTHDTAPVVAPNVAEAVRELRATLATTLVEGVPLRDALIGQTSDAGFYSHWERNKAALVVLLDGIDAEHSPPAPGND